MGSSSSTRRGPRGKSKSLTLHKEQHEKHQHKRCKSETPTTDPRPSKDFGEGKAGKKQKGRQEKMIPWESEGFSIPDRSNFQRSKSEPGDALNRMLSTSLRYSDFMKIVRKERVETDDVKPIFIPYKTLHMVLPDTLCHVCSVYTGSETYTCSVCYRVFHQSCLTKIGQCQEEAVKYLQDSQTEAGWSCHQCNNVSNLLTEEDMDELKEMLRRFNIVPEQDLSTDQYLSYRQHHCQESVGTEMTSDELREEIGVLGHLSKDSQGIVSWTNFLNHESLKILNKKNKNYLVRMLSGQEVEDARQMVKFRDTSGHGELTQDVLQRIISQLDRILHVSYRHEQIEYADDDQSGIITWDQFLQKIAIFLIAGRLNIFRKAVAEVKKRAAVEDTSRDKSATSASRVAVTSRIPQRVGTARSVYVKTSVYARVRKDPKATKRPMSMI